MIRVTRLHGPVQCPACREHLASGPMVGSCTQCKTPHHLPCLSELGCSSLNCNAVGALPEATPGTIRVGNLDAIVLGDVQDILTARYVMLGWLGVIGTHHFVFAGSFEDLPEEMAQWASEHAPGHLTEPEYELDGGGNCLHCGQDPHRGQCEHIEAAEADLTYCDPGLWLAWEWGGEELSGATLRRVQIRAMEIHLAYETGHITDDLANVRAEMADEVLFGDSIDVRLQVEDDGSWWVYSGDPSYDQDHRGYWGEGSINGSETRGELMELARDLINQAFGQHASAIDGRE